ncbi:MAG: hypothetical protein M3P44_11310 [Actinomycetota bacterium]|nr:hypothetical protein [Actinomycetota bacterium]
MTEVQNPSLETASGDTPVCWTLGGYGSNAFNWERTPDAHSASFAERLRVSSLTDGDRKLVTRQDSGDCAPTAVAGDSYAVSGWYRSDSEPIIYVYYRNSAGDWVYWAQSPRFAVTSSWTQASWTTPALPADATALSIGMGLNRTGWVTMDDFSLTDTTTTDPTTAAPSGCGAQTTWAPSTQTASDQYLYTPMSDSDAAACVSHVNEPVAGNVLFNAYVPSDSELSAFYSAPDDHGQTPRQAMWYPQYVTGRPGLTNPSTDDLIQWGAHKWGIPEDWLRAQYTQESDWNMLQLGDLRSETAACSPPFPAQAQVPPSSAYESMGITQVKWTCDHNSGAGTEPLRWKSTAFNIDYQASTIRFEYDNPYGDRSSWGDSSYQPQQQWPSVCAWFSSYPFNNSSARSYCSSVQTHLTARDWPKP